MLLEIQKDTGEAGRAENQPSRGHAVPLAWVSPSIGIMDKPVSPQREHAFISSVKAPQGLEVARISELLISHTCICLKSD